MRCFPSLPTHRAHSLHLLRAPWQSTQHSTASHWNNYFLTYNGPGALPKPSYTKALLKNLPTSYLIAYAIVLSPSLIWNIPLSKQWFIILAIENRNNRPMKMAKIVATLPSNYTCDSFIYLRVQQLNLHPHLMVNCGSALCCDNSRGEQRLDQVSWKKNPHLINTSAINYITKTASTKQEERRDRNHNSTSMGSKTSV